LTRPGVEIVLAAHVTHPLDRLPAAEIDAAPCAKVRRVPLSTGVFGHGDEVGVRLVQVLGFYQADADEKDLPGAHPSTALSPTST